MFLIKRLPESALVVVVCGLGGVTCDMDGVGVGSKSASNRNACLSSSVNSILLVRVAMRSGVLLVVAVMYDKEEAMVEGDGGVRELRVNDDVGVEGREPAVDVVGVKVSSLIIQDFFSTQSSFS